MTGTPWRDDEIEEVRKLRAMGATFSTIGEKLARSRNSIASVCKRLQIPSSGGMIIVQPPKRPAKVRPTAPKKITVMPKRVAPPNTVARSPLELQTHHCRWPVGDPREPDFYFCSEPRALPCSYCAKHAAIAYVPLKR
jgi:GcrA cell cycle regulator